MSKMMKLGLVVLIAAMTVAGCASSRSGSAYSRYHTQQEMTVRLGVVESVRLVNLEGTKTPVGTVTGAVVGGIAGSHLGRGHGSTVGVVVGAVAGGLAGSAIEEAATRRDGLEITVKLDNGQLTAVVQEADEQFRAGDRVRLLTSRGTTRVSH